MLTALRHALTERLMQAAPNRKPALRRADSDDWLLCTDVPGLISPAALDVLMTALTGDGWRMQALNGWLYLDHDLPAPHGARMPDGGTEAACVASLLLRHPDPVQDLPALRALCKAHEQGPARVERVCRALHAQYAQALREHRPLPGLLLPYLMQYACIKEETT